MLTERESEIVGSVLRAAVGGPFFPDSEFHTLMGMDRLEMRTVLESWRAVADHNLADVAISNAFNNLLRYPHSKWESWPTFSDAEEREVAHAFARWRAERGLSRPNTYLDGFM